MRRRGMTLINARCKTDMILCGGANIYPAEVESAIDSHPAVRSSCVIGLPDDDLVNVVHAIVDVADNALDEASESSHGPDASPGLAGGG